MSLQQLTDNREMPGVQEVTGNMVQCGPSAATTHQLGHLFSKPAGESHAVRSSASHPGLVRPASAPGAHAQVQMLLVSELQLVPHNMSVYTSTIWVGLCSVS